MTCPGSGMLAVEVSRSWRHPAPKRGTCRRCGREGALRHDGYTRKHEMKL